MAKQIINPKKGFTIIEVVLVLAIAGLIFLMVFVALPALQRSQRDTQRRQDISRVSTALTQWQTNHSTSIENLPKPGKYDRDAAGSGVWPNNCTDGSACEFIRDYMNSSTDSSKGNTFQDPDGQLYNVVITENFNKGTNITTTSLGDASIVINGSGTGARISLNENGGKLFNAHTMFIIPGARCEDTTAAPSELRHYAILYRLEGSGVYCLDDQ